MIENNIPNHSIFGSRRIAINVFENFNDIDKEYFYTSALTLILDENDEDIVTEENAKSITIFTDLIFDDPKVAAFKTAEITIKMFEIVSSTINLIDIHGETIKEFDFNTEFEEYDSLYGESDMETVSLETIEAITHVIKTKPTIH